MHLNFASLNHCTVQFLSCSVSVHAILESYETKSLHARRKKIRKHALKFVQTNHCQYMYLCNNHSQSFKLKHITHASACIIHDSTQSSEVKQGVT